MGATCAALVAALIAAVGFAQWSPPDRLQHGSPTSPAGPSSEMADDNNADTTANETVEATASPANETFINPEQVARQFCRQLAARLKQGNIVSPRELARQVASEKTFPMQPASATSGKLTAEAIYARTRESVVIVGGISPCAGRPHWHGTFATGFVARKDGVILTNAHVIDAFAETTAIGIMTNDGRVFPVTAVLAADLENDVAAIKVDADNLAPLPIAANVPVGATIYCLSHPLLDCEGNENAFWTFTAGIVSGKLRLRLDSPEPIDALAITADYAQGSSGGPILNEQGAVVGMVCHTMSLCADGDPGSMQMTWKMTRPSSSILALLQGKPPATATALNP